LNGELPGEEAASDISAAGSGRMVDRGCTGTSVKEMNVILNMQFQCLLIGTDLFDYFYWI